MRGGRGNGAGSRISVAVGDDDVRKQVTTAIAATASSHPTPSAVPSNACEAISFALAPTTTWRERWANDHHVKQATVPTAPYSIRPTAMPVA